MISSFFLLFACTDKPVPVDTGPDLHCEISPWIDVAVGYKRTCGVRSDGCVECWGLDGEGTLDDPPEGNFSSVWMPNYNDEHDFPYQHACALDAGGFATCWGENLYNQAYPPSDTAFTELALGQYSTCGLAVEGTIECWGEHSPAFVPDGDGYTGIAATYTDVCARHESGRVDCWDNEKTNSSQDWLATGLDIMHNVCGLVDGGTLSCVDEETFEEDGSIEEYERTPPENIQSFCKSGSVSGCSIDADGTPSCWGTAAIQYDPMWEQLPDAAFTRLTCSLSTVCGLSKDQEIFCWGQDLGHLDAP